MVSLNGEPARGSGATVKTVLRYPYPYTPPHGQRKNIRDRINSAHRSSAARIRPSRLPCRRAAKRPEWGRAYGWTIQS
jgi:hypothetical protein